MPSPRAGSYRDVLTLPRTLPIFGAALLGRLSYGLLPLSLLFTVQRATGSFAAGGSAIAVFGLASFTLPFKSRLVDHYGRRVLLPLAAGAAIGLLLLATLAWLARPGPVVCLVLSAAAGLAAPPLGPAMRSTWRDLVAGTALMTPAYSLDAVCEETLYLGGPLLVGVVLLTGPPAVALVLTAVLMLLGTLGMVAASARLPASVDASVDAPAPRAETGRSGPLAVAGVRRVLVVVFTAACGLGLAGTGVAARAQEVGAPSAAGWIDAGVAATSVLGGLAWGRRHHRASASMQVAGLVLVLGVGTGLAGLTPGLILLGAAMALGGLALSPLFVVAYLAVDEAAPEHQRTEAGTWVNTVNNLGAAAGSSLAGLAVDRVDVHTVFAAGAGLLLTTALLTSDAGSYLRGCSRQLVPVSRRRVKRPS